MGAELSRTVCLDGTESPKAPVLETPPQHSRHHKLLFGCQTYEEHVDYIEEACAIIARKRGEKGLAELGLEFRQWHHPKACKCSVHKKEQVDLATCTPTKGGQDAQEETKSHREYHRQRSSLTPESSSSDDISTDEKNISNFRQPNFNKISELSLRSDKEFLVPIGEPISRETSFADLQHQEVAFGTRMGSERSVNTSFTMFSLTTHHSRISGETSDSGRSTKDYFEACSMRLYHKASNTIITEKNHEFFIAHGKMYDEVARLCMEYAQDAMIKEGDLEWQHVGNGIGALVSRKRCFEKPLLLVVTGKGKVGAGIFSRRHLMTSGLEVATALPFVRDAIERNMNLILLDPNANGTQKAMKAVQRSLETLFFEQGTAKEDIYILAHSMAGSQLVRFLHDNTFIKTSTSGSPTNTPIPNVKAGSAFLQQIKAVAFTDSNHNINWTKNNPPVTDLLVGEASLYIKSHKLHDDKKRLGELHHDCQFWKHRFGSIKTIWGGTNEHALTNYTGNDYIWDHFDNFLDDE